MKGRQKKNLSVPLSSWDSDEVLNYTKTFEDRAVVYLSTIMPLYVCSRHSKNYGWPIKNERAYRMPSRNPSRISGSEETIMWKLLDLKEIKEKCLFGFFFFQRNQDLFFSLHRSLMQGKRWTLVPTKIHSQERSHWALSPQPFISWLCPTEQQGHNQQ